MYIYHTETLLYCLFESQQIYPGLFTEPVPDLLATTKQTVKDDNELDSSEEKMKCDECETQRVKTEDGKYFRYWASCSHDFSAASNKEEPKAGVFL